MALDGVPWAIGGGAEHSPEVARLLAYAALGGGEGVVASTDLKVTALPVPGGAVRVLPGAGAALVRSAGGSQQTYIGRNVVAEDVAIAATGSGGGRTDLIVMQVEDPYMAGEPWEDPADPTVGPYVFFRVISGVPAGTTRVQDVAGGNPAYANRSAITLARIEIPANTQTITAAMIKDVRVLARGRTRSMLLQARNGLSAGPEPRNPLTIAKPAFIRWPDVATWQVRVPEWATHVIARGRVESFAVKAGLVTGLVRVSAMGLSTEAGSYDENGTANAYRSSIGFGGELEVAAQYRGKAVTFNLDGNRSENAGFIDADLYTSAYLDLTFEERTT